MSAFDYLHIEDMTRGCLAVAENIEQVSGEAFNFGGGTTISVRDLVKLIESCGFVVSLQDDLEGNKCIRLSLHFYNR